MNKEQIYDEKISPLMAEIIKVCKDFNISMLATFDIPTKEDSGLCCTTYLPDETGVLPKRIRECSKAASARVVYKDTTPLMITTTKADGSKKIMAFLD